MCSHPDSPGRHKNQRWQQPVATTCPGKGGWAGAGSHSSIAGSRLLRYQNTLPPGASLPSRHVYLDVNGIKPKSLLARQKQVTITTQ